MMYRCTDETNFSFSSFFFLNKYIKLVLRSSNQIKYQKISHGGGFVWMCFSAYLLLLKNTYAELNVAMNFILTLALPNHEFGIYKIEVAYSRDT